jgi:hypothetical protein
MRRRRPGLLAGRCLAALPGTGVPGSQCESRTLTTRAVRVESTAKRTS